MRTPAIPHYGTTLREVGYSHFRLGSLDKARVIEHDKQAYPATGDVSYVMFRESYLELVQI